MIDTDSWKERVGALERTVHALAKHARRHARRWAFRANDLWYVDVDGRTIGRVTDLDDSFVSSVSYPGHTGKNWGQVIGSFARQPEACRAVEDWWREQDRAEGRSPVAYPYREKETDTQEKESNGLERVSL